MTAITLEAVKARHEELGSWIGQLEAQAKARAPRSITLDEVRIELQPGEHYAGLVLDADGTPKHHLVLMTARPADRLNWDDAKKWAEDVGGSLPDRQEQALLFANCKPHLEETWHWSSQQHEENASYAWCCHFLSGLQYGTRKSYEGSAVAVRRV